MGVDSKDVQDVIERAVDVHNEQKNSRYKKRKRRSKLDLHKDLILTMYNDGYSLSVIQTALRDVVDQSVSCETSTIHRYIRRHQSF